MEEPDRPRPSGDAASRLVTEDLGPYSQAELAERMGTTQSAIARLESGRVSPTVETLQKYARALGKRLKIEMV